MCIARVNKFDEILEYVKREANGENIVKTKRPKSPKRKKSPNK